VEDRGKLAIERGANLGIEEDEPPNSNPLSQFCWQAHVDRAHLGKKERYRESGCKHWNPTQQRNAPAGTASGLGRSSHYWKYVAAKIAVPGGKIHIPPQCRYPRTRQRPTGNANRGLRDHRRHDSATEFLPARSSNADGEHQYMDRRVHERAVH